MVVLSVRAISAGAAPRYSAAVSRTAVSASVSVAAT